MALIGIVGEALIDLIGSYDAKNIQSFYPFAGGCAVNTAIAASRMGSKVMYIGKLSSDMFGNTLRQHLEKNRVHLSARFCDCECNSMIGFVRLDEKGSASYLFYTQGTTIEELKSYEICETLEAVPEIAFLHIGSVALTLDTSAAEIEKAMGSMTHLPSLFLDPNVRPLMVSDWNGYRQRLLRIAGKSLVVKLSDEDLQHLFPAIAPQVAIQVMLRQGANNIVLTKGPEGLHWYSDQGFDIAYPATKVSVSDTVGAGDTVSGALLSYLDTHSLNKASDITQNHVLRMLQLASIASSITCSRKGCDPPYREELPKNMS